jgi:hypothetical protein
MLISHVQGETCGRACLLIPYSILLSAATSPAEARAAVRCGNYMVEVVGSHISLQWTATHWTSGAVLSTK